MHIPVQKGGSIVSLAIRQECYERGALAFFIWLYSAIFNNPMFSDKLKKLYFHLRLFY